VTLVAGHAAPDPTVAETHVLIIGIGDYPNAHQTPTASLYSALLGVTPLTSSTISAREIADWFLAEFHNPDAPLGSLELLLSEPAPSIYHHAVTKAPYAVDRADFAHFQTAFREWEARCDSSKDNLAVFYYSGHAAESANRILLPSDFPVPVPPGGEPDWNQVVNFNATRAGMEYCKAAHQFYFLDCCRTPLTAQFAAQSFGVRLSHPRITVAVRTARAQPTYTIPEKTTTGGAPGQRSAFTDLLLHSLRGAGAERRGGLWQVTQTRLLDACQRIREEFQEIFHDHQADHQAGLPVSPYPDVELDPGVPMKGDPKLHQFPAHQLPRVPACVRCRPDAAASAAAYSAVQSGCAISLAGKQHSSRYYAHGFLNPGDHIFRLAFNSGVWTADDQAKLVEPPVCVCDFEARDV
jgi:hypothetical protein